MWLCWFISQYSDGLFPTKQILTCLIMIIYLAKYLPCLKVCTIQQFHRTPPSFRRLFLCRNWNFNFPITANSKSNCVTGKNQYYPVLKPFNFRRAKTMTLNVNHPIIFRNSKPFPKFLKIFKKRKLKDRINILSFCCY